MLGSLLIKLNASAAVYRRNSFIHDWPTLEVVAFSAITAAISYLVSVFEDNYILVEVCPDLSVS